MSAYPNQRDEADTIAQRIAAAVRRGDRRLRDFAVFYRVNALSRALELSFREAGVPYQLVRGLEFYQRKEIKDVLGYLTLLNNPRDDTAFLRVVNMPLRGIGKASLERLAWHAARFGGSLFEAAREVQLIEDMPKRSAKRLQEFVVLIDELTARGAHTIEELIGHVLSRTGYREHLEASKQAEDQERLANVEELLTAARQFDERGGESGGLEAFLEESSLVNDVDDWSETDDRVALMSLHASKGLEFPVVFIMAVEEKILPHEQSAKNLDQLEEERRLLFVGMTRAREELYLSLARQRDFRGSRRMTVPSSFLFELPLEELEVDGLPSADGYEANDDQSSHEEPVYQAHAGGTHAEDGPGDEPHGVEFDPAAFVASRDTSAESPPAAASMPRLTTAAEMAGESTYRDDAPPVPAESFRHGMVVLHPDYGLGTVLALSGSGERRVATVEFAGYGEKKFVLAHSPLRPVKRRS